MAARAELVTLAGEPLLRRMRSARERILLASPYLSMTAAKRLLEAAAASSAMELRLLTALDEGSVRGGSLSPTALAALREGGFELASIANLHAKLSLVDADWGLVGSGNLTGAGLGLEGMGNVELGVELGSAQLDGAAAIYARWWKRADPVSADELERLATLPVEPVRGSGTALGPTLRPSGAEELEAILAEDAEAAASRRYWIKANYHRHDQEDWWKRGWISDSRHASYAVGDLIVLYLSAREGGPACCPAIVRAATPARHDPGWVIDHGDAEAIPQWPFVTETQRGYCSITREQFEAGARALKAS